MPKLILGMDQYAYVISMHDSDLIIKATKIVAPAYLVLHFLSEKGENIVHNKYIACAVFKMIW